MTPINEIRPVEWVIAVAIISFLLLLGATLRDTIFPRKAPVIVSQPPWVWTNTSPMSMEGLMKWVTLNNEILTLSVGIDIKKIETNWMKAPFPPGYKATNAYLGVRAGPGVSLTTNGGTIFITSANL